MKNLTEELLRAAINEAKKKGQIGMLIWSNWAIWDDVAIELKEGNEHYDFALAQVNAEKVATITYEWAGFKLAAAFAVSIKKLSENPEFFRGILQTCEKGHYTGPITLLPLNEVAECC